MSGKACCKTRILQVTNPGGGAGSGPLNVSYPSPGVIRITDSVSGEFADLPLNYIQDHDNNADWTAVGTDWSILIPESTHGLGLSPSVEIYEINAGVLKELDTQNVQINAVNGDVTITVPQVPDGRYTGRIKIFF